jgi:hypothetical protein
LHKKEKLAINPINMQAAKTVMAYCVFETILLPRFAQSVIDPL